MTRRSAYCFYMDCAALSMLAGDTAGAHAYVALGAPAFTRETRTIRGYTFEDAKRRNNIA